MVLGLCSVLRNKFKIIDHNQITDAVGKFGSLHNYSAKIRHYLLGSMGYPL